MLPDDILRNFRLLILSTQLVLMFYASTCITIMCIYWAFGVLMTLQKTMTYLQLEFYHLKENDKEQLHRLIQIQQDILQ